MSELGRFLLHGAFRNVCSPSRSSGSEDEYQYDALYRAGFVFFAPSQEYPSRPRPFIKPIEQ